LIRELSRQNPDCEFLLFGTPNDREISDAIVTGCGIPLQDMTGKTDLRQLALELAGCRVVIGNDTGGMHLANAVGTPVAVLFGPTNPLVTAPFFDVPKACIQPDGCPPEGGRSIQSLTPDEVEARLLDFLETGLVTGKV
jgi:ADP-heptose:LPS heptosyltransferase